VNVSVQIVQNLTFVPAELTQTSKRDRVFYRVVYGSLAAAE